MSHDVGAAHGHHDDHHGGHWEWSVYPFLASFGIFALALAFSFHFVYHSSLLAALATVSSDHLSNLRRKLPISRQFFR